VAETVKASVQETASSSGRAGAHLATAWREAYGRDPDPTAAYREAVRGVEAAAKPVVLPNNDAATLGTMIAAMRDAPGKWKTVFTTPPAVDGVGVVRGLMELLW